MDEYRAYVGIDWGDRVHSVVLWDSQTGVEEAAKIEQTPAALHAWAESLYVRYEGQPVAVAIEQSRGAVFDALLGYKFLDLFPINPRSAASYREAFRPSCPKDDPTDAAWSLDMLRKHREQLRRFVPDEVKTRKLRLLVEDRRCLVNQRTAHVQRVEARLKTYFPQALEWAGSLATRQACDFLEKWPTLAALQNARPSEIRKFYRRRAHGSQWIEEKLDQITSAVALVDDEAIVAAAVLFIRSEIAQVRALIDSIAEYDRQIASTFEAHEDAPIFKSFPGAGEQLAPRLAVAFGTVRDRWASAIEVSEQSGIAPVLHRSGKTVTVQMRWACPKFTRQSFHEFAGLSISQSVWARTFYQRRREKGADHHAAIRALAYRWIRIMYACWKNRSTYDEAFYLQQLRRRGSPLVAA
jgi:transposase